MNATMRRRVGEAAKPKALMNLFAFIFPLTAGRNLRSVHAERATRTSSMSAFARRYGSGCDLRYDQYCNHRCGNI